MVGLKKFYSYKSLFSIDNNDVSGKSVEDVVAILKQTKSEIHVSVQRPKAGSEQERESGAPDS